MMINEIINLGKCIFVIICAIFSFILSLFKIIFAPIIFLIHIFTFIPLKKETLSIINELNNEELIDFIKDYDKIPLDKNDCSCIYTDKKLSKIFKNELRKRNLDDNII